MSNISEGFYKILASYNLQCGDSRGLSRRYNHTTSMHVDLDSDEVITRRRSQGILRIMNEKNPRRYTESTERHESAMA
jgi:hypothetical protein